MRECVCVDVCEWLTIERKSGSSAGRVQTDRDCFTADDIIAHIYR